MQLEERTVGDVTVVKVTGDITLSSGGDVLLKDKAEPAAAGQEKAPLDLGSVSYVDSGGLGQLVQCNVTASKNGGSLKLLNMTKRLNDLLCSPCSPPSSTRTTPKTRRSRASRKRYRSSVFPFVSVHGPSSTRCSRRPRMDRAYARLIALVINAVALWVTTRLVSASLTRRRRLAVRRRARVRGAQRSHQPFLLLLSLRSSSSRWGCSRSSSTRSRCC